MIRRNSKNDIISETYGKFIIKNPQSNRTDSNVTKVFIGKDEIRCELKRLTNLPQPTDENDACTKSYVDSKIRSINSPYVTIYPLRLITNQLSELAVITTVH